MKHLHLDFETRSAVDLKKCGADVYARHHSTDAMCAGFAFDDDVTDLLTPEDFIFAPFLDYVKAGGIVIAHNAPFELAIWNHVMRQRHGWPELKPEQVICTMAMSYAMALPGSLENAAAAMGITHQKDMQGSRVMMQLAQPRDVKPDGTVVWWDEEESTEKYQRMYAYCKQDIEVERELFKRLMMLSPEETDMWRLDYVINQRGICIDTKSVAIAIEIVNAEKKRLDDEMREVTGNQVAACTAVGQLSDFLKWRGVEVKVGIDKAAVVEMLSCDIPDDCRKALLLRQEAGKTSTSKLEAMLFGVCADGRIRGTTQYHGAGTGRWAGRRLQVHNFPRPIFSQEDIDGVFRVLGDVE